MREREEREERGIKKEREGEREREGDREGERREREREGERGRERERERERERDREREGGERGRVSEVAILRDKTHSIDTTQGQQTRVVGSHLFTEVKN